MYIALHAENSSATDLTKPLTLTNLTLLMAAASRRLRNAIRPFPEQLPGLQLA